MLKYYCLKFIYIYIYISGYKYLYGLAGLKINLSPNPLSSHNVSDKPNMASQNDFCGTRMLSDVAFLGTGLSTFLAKVILSPLPSKSRLRREMYDSCLVSYLFKSLKKTGTFICDHDAITISGY